MYVKKAAKDVENHNMYSKVKKHMQPYIIYGVFFPLPLLQPRA